MENSIYNTIESNTEETKEFNRRLNIILSIMETLENYSYQKIQMDKDKNYIFHIIQNSELYNNKSLNGLLSSFLNNNTIKIYNYLDMDSLNRGFVNMKLFKDIRIPVFCLLIGNNDFSLTSLEHKIQTDEKLKINNQGDIYFGFVSEDNCKNIKIYINNELFEEFNNCKKDYYYHFHKPIFSQLVKDKVFLFGIEKNKEIEIEINNEFFINISLVQIFFSNDDKKINDSKVLGWRKQFCNSNFYNKNIDNFNYSYNKFLTKQKFKNLEKELIEKTMHPNRVIDWCLDIEEQKELC
jgi:hypothetical protein